MSKKVGVIVGSLRKGSYNQSVAEFIGANLPDGFEAQFIDISQLPLYNQDYDEASPESYVTFREAVKGVDAVLFVSPEHNRSFSAAIKNALDVASRPWGQNVWAGKPGAVVTTSIGAIGGFGANHHLRQVLSFLDIKTLAQPEMYVGNAMSFIDDKGQVTDESTGDFLKGFAVAFADWIKVFDK